MTIRSTISRREPVIALESFRYKGRNYKEGGYLDRRRCRMPHSKLVRLIREGACILAKNVDPEKLAEYGFTYNPENPRIKLNRISNEKVPKHGTSYVKVAHASIQDFLKQKNDLAMREHFEDDEPEIVPATTKAEEELEMAEAAEDDESFEPTLKHAGGGWYDIMVNGKQVNEAGLRKDDAQKFLTDYKEGL